MRRPLIGITGEMTAAGWGDRVREAVLLPASYARAVERAGCIPLLLPSAPRHATDLATALDGVVFSDGARDAGQFALMQAVVAGGLPVLAIGHGMRMLNAVNGGSPAGPGAAEPPPGPGAWTDRDVRLSPDSTLGRLLGTSLTAPFASGPPGRDQALDGLSSGVRAVAWTDGECITAIELTGHPFAIGLGWHPEQGDDIRVFEGLGEAAGARSPAA